MKSLEDVFPAHIAVADPTLRLDRSQKMLLSWYLGGPGWDPMDDILKVVNRAKGGRTGAKHVLCIGGSGGGFAALRISAHISGSMAYVQAPATDIHNCFPTAKSNYFGKVWQGWDADLLLDAFPRTVQHASPLPATVAGQLRLLRAEHARPPTTSPPTSNRSGCARSNADQ